MQPNPILTPTEPHMNQQFKSEHFDQQNHQAAIVETPMGHIAPVGETSTGSSDIPVTPSLESLQASEPSQNDQPIPVVRVLSIRGVEYGMMTLSLWVAATTLAW